MPSAVPYAFYQQIKFLRIAHTELLGIRKFPHGAGLEDVVVKLQEIITDLADTVPRFGRIRIPGVAQNTLRVRNALDRGVSYDAVARYRVAVNIAAPVNMPGRQEAAGFGVLGVFRITELGEQRQRY
jgi:hypothetical protein